MVLVLFICSAFGLFPVFVFMGSAAVTIRAQVLVHVYTYFSWVFNYKWNCWIIRYVYLYLY